MNKNWQGKAVSIQCVESLGVFQGTIKEANATKITIIRAFRNGLPLRTLDTEITIMATDIIKLELIPALNNDTPVMIGNGAGGAATSSNGNGTNPRNGESSLSSKLKDFKNNKLSKSPTNNNHQRNRPQQQQQPQTIQQQQKSMGPSNSPYNAQKIFSNMIPAKVEVRMAASAPNTMSLIPSGSSFNASSKPIDVPVSHQRHTNNVVTPGSTPYKGGNGNGNKRQQRPIENRQTQAYASNQAFGTPTDDPAINEDFDFEKNLALFDKQAIWDEIDAIQKPDLLRQTTMVKKQNYRHDENVLTSKPTGSRQIISEHQCNLEFATDDGLIIPAVPVRVRNMVQKRAETEGLSWLRQCDMLARGATELALMLLGGARRLTPKNQHQWPTIVIVCDEPANERVSELGISAGRQLASHGLKICIYVPGEPRSDRRSFEMALFTAFDHNTHTHSVSDLPSMCDCVILAVRSNLQPDITKWIIDNRSPTLAIDPPALGIHGITIKYSIVPILPLENTSSNCGKLYLCNLGIPDKFYTDSGIRYRSPFGHKSVIPIHRESESDL